MRTRHAQPLIDVRQLGELIEAFDNGSYPSVPEAKALHVDETADATIHQVGLEYPEGRVQPTRGIESPKNRPKSYRV